MSHPALSVTEHRPWPAPRRPWIVAMEWHDLMFLHWPVAAATLQARLPEGLTVETFDGDAWLGVVPFRMRMRFRGLPPVPGGHNFPELNVRTYVRHGDRSGVYFFSLDAASRLAVGGARATFGLPYLNAKMACGSSGGGIDYRCTRTDRRAPPAQFDASYSAIGPSRCPEPGSLEHFLTERYGLLVAGRDGRVRMGEIAHVPWRLAPAQCRLTACDMTRLLDIELRGAPVSALVAEPQHVVAWWLSPPR